MPSITAVFVSWTESERGWGMRPDGCSIHMSMDEWRRYLREFQESQPKEVPAEYSFPGTPRPIDISDEEIIARLKEKKSLRLFDGHKWRAKLEASCKM